MLSSSLFGKHIKAVFCGFSHAVHLGVVLLCASLSQIMDAFSDVRGLLFIFHLNMCLHSNVEPFLKIPVS